ncbi:hypothetical protein ES703_74994 [subsurface metagenome]
MDTIIALLKAALGKYQHGEVADGDKLLTTASRLRREDARAKKAIAEAKTPATTKEADKT